MRKAGQLRCMRVQLLLFIHFTLHEHAAAATCVQDVFPSTLLEVWGRVGSALHAAAASRGLVSAVQNQVIDHAALLLEIARPNWARTFFYIAKNKFAQKTAGLADHRDRQVCPSCLDSWGTRAQKMLYPF